MKKLVSAYSLLCCFGALGAEAPATFKVGEFTFTPPAKWEWVESRSAMRKAQLKTPELEGKGSAEVVFFHFGAGDGGGTQANVERWYHQFSDARDKKSEEKTIAGHKVTYVQVRGTYSSGMPGGPQTPMKDYALQGAILESPQGSVFVRMVGPEKAVDASVAEFKKMIESGLK